MLISLFKINFYLEINFFLFDFFSKYLKLNLLLKEVVVFEAVVKEDDLASFVKQNATFDLFAAGVHGSNRILKKVRLG